MKLPEKIGPGVVLLHDAHGVSRALEQLASQLVERGFAVATPPLLEEQAVDRLADGVALEAVRSARLDLERAGVDPTRIYAVGTGLGGTLAMVAPSAVARLAGAVAFGGRLVVPTLTDHNPVQPMDLLPGVRVPLQLHYGAEDPLVPPHHVQQLRDRLGRLGIAHQVLVYPGVGAGLIDPELPGHEPGAAHTAIARAVRFLERLAMK